MSLTGSRSFRFSTIGLSVAAVLCGCAHGPRHRSPATTPGRDTVFAQQENTKGLRAVEEGQFADARAAFAAAIEHDLYYAPAHNNLGLTLLENKRYYEAAWAFQRAAQLAPESPEPRTNLGLLYEKIGRLDQAETEYGLAIEIDPQNLVAMRHLARAYVKADRRDDRLKQLLERILAQPPDNPQWDVWARGQLIRLGRPEEPGAAGPPFAPPSPGR